jgi:hypothetical protein
MPVAMTCLSRMFAMELVPFVVTICTRAYRGLARDHDYLTRLSHLDACGFGALECPKPGPSDGK